MIIPNLMVSDMRRSLAFYRDGLGMELVTAITAGRTTLDETDGSDAVFAILATAGGQLMLQTIASLRDELPGLPERPAFSGTVYVRGVDPRQVAARMEPDDVLKPVVRQWYGMLEVYVRDPDGYIVCVGIADGPPVA